MSPSSPIHLAFTSPGSSSPIVQKRRLAPGRGLFVGVPEADLPMALASATATACRHRRSGSFRARSTRPRVPQIALVGGQLFGRAGHEHPIGRLHRPAARGPASARTAAAASRRCPADRRDIRTANGPRVAGLPAAWAEAATVKQGTAAVKQRIARNQERSMWYFSENERSHAAERLALLGILRRHRATLFPLATKDRLEAFPLCTTGRLPTSRQRSRQAHASATVGPVPAERWLATTGRLRLRSFLSPPPPAPRRRSE